MRTLMLPLRASTPPRTPSWHVTTRPVTPVFQSRPTTPVQRRPAEQSSPSSSRLDNLRSHDSTTSSPSQKVKDEPGGEAAHIRAQLTENHLASTQAAESRRPDYLKRMRRLAPSNSTGAGTSFTSDLGGKDGSLLWSSANVGVIDSPVKGKRIALFQETSEESFEESLMAGGYGRYRSDRPFWKLDEDIEAAPNRLADATEEEGLVPGLVLTEEGRRKKARLAAFLDPPREPSSATQLFPVEIQGCGRVLMRVEPSEPQTPPKPTPKTKRSRKRKNMSADMKQDVVKGSIAAPEDGTIDGPNWPDTEFPWRSRLMTQDGLSSAEREERLRYIESFLDRDSDEDVEEGHSLPSRRSPDEASSRSPQPGRGKMYPVLSHSKKRPRSSTTLSLIRSDPADAKTALLSKKSIRAVQLRLLRRRNTDRTANGGDSETLCICQGRDDGRPLVQCDACQTWYHLECIGIQSTSELGREEDPWFCANCVEVKTPPPVDVLSEPTFVPTDDGEHGVGRRNSAGLEEYDPLFLNAGLNPSPATPWTRSVRPPTTPPRTQHAPNTTSGSSWDEPPSSSSRGDPRTPQFNTASAFGDMVRVYGTTPGRLLEPSSSTVIDGVQFDPTSTPSRGIRFGLPFTTPKGLSSWHGVRGTGQELFHTPLRPGEDGNAASSSRYGQPLLYHGRVGEVSEEGPSGVHMGLYRTGGTTNVTPVERDALDGPKRLQVLESPLGAKRSRRTADS
ncbi:hypothetical protein J3R82DRAFT_1266 [Butyriboletus roseoflavus]|nr:hypothetical protein J3R82DRAFT_1266 [Butyriboletus roseoflavus]